MGEVSELSDRIKAASAFELDNHATDWAKGIHSESARLKPLLDSLCACAEALEKFANYVPRDGSDIIEKAVNESYALESRRELTALRETLARMEK